jgi:RNA polymerase sigma-70 factor (ECF subfamily)
MNQGTVEEEVHKFQEMLERLNSGCPEASRELLERYGPHIQRVIRRRLDRRLRSKFDTIDFVQSVWASFFAHQGTRKPFDSPEAFIAYLAAMAKNKVVDAYRQRLQTKQYNVRRERSISNESTGFAAEHLRSPGATPSQYLIADEEWERLLSSQPPAGRRILLMLRQGQSHGEIASEVGVHERTIRRLLRRLHPGLA